MQVRQISIFLENRVGRLQEVADVLAQSGVNIRALSLADTSDFGILRLIVNRPEEATQVLRDSGFTVRENEVIAAEVEDRPGGLARLLDLFAGAGISVEYMYAFVERRTSNAVMIFRVESVPKAVKVLQDAGIPLLSNDDVCAL
ncbi:MAG: ACT domain-containing protein [Candidatus Latescibacterota bacterium]